MTDFASMLLVCVGLYAMIGLIVAACFVIWGVARVDPAAKGTGIGFRLMILPGAAVLWPVVLGMWLRARQGAKRAGARAGA